MIAMLHPPLKVFDSGSGVKVNGREVSAWCRYDHSGTGCRPRGDTRVALFDGLSYSLGTMKRVLLTSLAIWVLLLGPGLCMSGTLEHLCIDCSEGISCEHEEDCIADPCVENMQRPDTTASSSGPATIAAVVPGCVTSDPNLPGTTLTEGASLLAYRMNLPRPESDLPLLI